MAASVSNVDRGPHPIVPLEGLDPRIQHKAERMNDGSKELLTCRNHKDRLWWRKPRWALGKNIFFVGWWDAPNEQLMTGHEHECPCPGSDLVSLTYEDGQGR